MSITANVKKITAYMQIPLYLCNALEIKSSGLLLKSWLCYIFFKEKSRKIRKLKNFNDIKTRNIDIMRFSLLPRYVYKIVKTLNNTEALSKKQFLKFIPYFSASSFLSCSKNGLLCILTYLL